MRIPTNPLYDISEDAVVTLISTGEVQKEYISRHCRRAVKIRGKSHKPSSHPLDRLMLITYKPTDKDPEWLSVSFRNGNRDDLRIENLEWDYRQYRVRERIGEHIPLGVWFKVPGVSLEIRIVERGPELRRYVDKYPVGVSPRNGYMETTVKIDGKQQRLHRLLALTFLDHPLDTEHLTVNHKDSNKLNNTIRNLEWATYSDNNMHAFTDGVRGETQKKILLRRLSDGQEFVVGGYHEMARLLGVSPQSAHQAVERRTTDGKPFHGYIFKKADDPRSWEELSRNPSRIGDKADKSIVVMDLKTHRVLAMGNRSEVAVKYGMRHYVLDRLLMYETVIPWKGMGFRLAEEGELVKWPVYPEEVLDIFDRTKATDRPLNIVGGDGVVRYYTSVTEWCNEDREKRCDPAVMSRMLKSSDGTMRWRSWNIQHVDLKKFPVIEVKSCFMQ
jgi:hypothetical protein